MIIVKKTIFEDLLKRLTEESLTEFISTHFLEAPLADDLEFGDWLYAQFVSLGGKVGADTQADFGAKLDVAQGDFSKLINRPNEISVSIDRKKQIQSACKAMFISLSKKAS